MNEEKAEYRNKQRSSFWWATLMWCLLLVLAYYGLDIVEKGKALNEMTSYPIWGYVLWAVIVIFLWVLVVGPAIHFCNLRYVGEESLRRQVLRATDALGAYRREPEESELRQLSEEFGAAPRDFTSLEGKHGWQELLARFREAVHGRAHDTIIGYCKAAGVAMVFGFNGLLDGLVLLAIQVRLVLELARVYGYKPTSFFNGCFFGWVAVNSLVVALTSGVVDGFSASLVASMIGAGEGVDPGTVRTGLQLVISVLIQAFIAGALTYVSGRVFLWRLEHEGREVALKTLLKLRVEGRREYAAKLLGASAALGLMEEEAQKPTGVLSGRLLQLFGHRLGNKPAEAAPAALEAPEEPEPLPSPAPEPPAPELVPAAQETPQPEPHPRAGEEKPGGQAGPDAWRPPGEAMGAVRCVSLLLLPLCAPLWADATALPVEKRLQQKFELIACSNNATLHEAASAGDVRALRKCLSEGAPRNELDELGNTPLHYAARGDSPEIVRLLLSSGANPRVKDKEGRIPLDGCHHPGIRKLLAHTQPKRGKELEADEMARRGNVKGLRHAFRQEGVSPEARSAGGTGTLLMSACAAGQAEVVRFLINEHADVLACDTASGCGPLHMAARHGHADIVSLLLEAGADPMQESQQGFYALHEAVLNADVAVLEALLPAYKEVNFSPGEAPGSYPIYLALDHGREAVVRAFLKVGLNPNDKRFADSPLFLYATERKQYVCSSLLAAAGASKFATGLVRKVRGEEDKENMEEDEEDAPRGGERKEKSPADYVPSFIKKFL